MIDQLSLVASVRGQLTSLNLDSSQKFILGGTTGVRAYPSGEASADEGHAVTLEVRYDAPGLPSWLSPQLTAFFDGGWVKLHHRPWKGSLPSESGKNCYRLGGAGVGLNLGKPGLYSVQAAYAHTVGPNPGAAKGDENADGRSDKSQLWLVGELYF